MNSFKIGAIAMLSEKVVKMATQLGMLVLLAHYLGPEKLGILMYCFAIASIFVFLNNLGLDTLLVKRFVEFTSKQHSYLMHAFSMRLIAALLSIVLVNTAGYWLIDEEYRLLLFIISLYHIFLPINLFEWLFQAQGKSTLSAIGLITGHLFGFAFRAFILYLGGDLIWLGLAYSIELAVTGFVYLYFFNQQKNKKQLKIISKQRALKLLNEAKPLIISGAIVLLYMKMDQIMLGLMVSPTEVGIYVAATRLSEAWYFVGLTVIAVFYPKFLMLKKNHGETAYENEIVRIGRLIVWGAIILAFITSFISPYIINILYDKAFAQSAQVLTVAMWAIPFVYLGTISTKMLVTANRQDLVLWRSVTGLVVNLILNLILIPKYGALGAAISTVIAQAMSGLLFNLLGKTKLIFKIQLKIVSLL
ncbi:flippase [Thiomicrorhabdus hydrogeniphila]